jgi:uncharacterized protein YbbC (DUF1343 family)
MLRLTGLRSARRHLAFLCGLLLLLLATSTAAGAISSTRGSSPATAATTPPAPQPTPAPRVIVGLEVLRNDSFKLLAGESVAILTNPTGVFPDSLANLVDVLHAHQANVNVCAVLAPEHGFRGDHQAETGDPDQYVDAATGLTVYSVYRKNQSDIQAILRETGATLLLVDIQDVGTRLYTFVWTMFDVLQAVAAGLPSAAHDSTEAGPWSSDVAAAPAAATGGAPTDIGGTTPVRRVVVLDRPNPVGGDAVEGPLLNTSCCTSRYGKAPVTHRHGLTIGELALLFDGLSFNSSLKTAEVRARSVAVVEMVMRLA